MKFPRLQFAAAAAAVILLGLFGRDAQPQPARTIKIVVPLAPGGGADILMRLLADHIRRIEGVGVVVENRVGAGSVIGTEAVSHAAPDGNTLLINTPNLVIAAHLRKLNYDPLTSFEPICKLVNSPTVVAVNIASPYRSLADLLNVARAHAGERWARNHVAHFRRKTQTHNPDQHDLHSVFGQRSDGERAVREPCHGGVRRVSGRGGANQGRPVAGTRHRLADADGRASGVADRCRIRIPGL